MQHASRLRAKASAAVGRFARDESGASAIEYAIIAAGVGVAVASTVWSLGEQVKTNLYNKITGAF